MQSNSTVLEWQNVTGYTFGETVQFRSIPLTFNFSDPTQYLSWSGPPTWDGSFLPSEAEPGGYSLYYPFLYGGNHTVVVNLIGGGASASSVGHGASVFTTIDIGVASGGAQSFWVRDGHGTNGRLLFSSPLLDNMGPPAPPGFEGAETFAWSPDTNGTVTLGIVNAYGVSVPIGYYQATVHSAGGPTFNDTLLFVFLGIAAGFVLLGVAIQRHVEVERGSSSYTLARCIEPSGRILPILTAYLYLMNHFYADPWQLPHRKAPTFKFLHVLSVPPRTTSNWG